MNNMAKGKSNPLKRLLNRRSSSTNTSQRKARWKDLLPLLFTSSAIGLILSYGQISSNDKSEILDSYLEGAPPPIPHKDFWEQPESSCIHVDNVCSQRDKWFYASSGKNDGAYQPTIKLVLDKNEIAPQHGHDIQINTNIKFDVSSSSYWFYDKDTCKYSSVPHHLVVQSAYNDMVGEFYSRTMLGLNQWMRDYPPISYDDIQTYVHFVDKRKRLFEGHKLFLSGLPNNNKFYSFESLMPDGPCRCYRKLIFCGYNVEKATATNIGDNVENATMSSGSESTDKNSTSTSKKEKSSEEQALVIKPRGNIRNKKVECKWQNRDCIAYRKLRTDLLKTYSSKDPDLDEKIREYQRQILAQKGIVGHNITNSTVGGWKFIGLAHRKYRRIWLNIDDAMSMCDKHFRSHNIVCIKVDVEEAESPEQQFLMHRSLHAFIGVHGAQLTQGVLLPKHAYILELLPWVPYYLWGAWVATIHCPTPLGIIFSKTQLNHVGYPLDRESVPLCTHVDRSDEVAERLCLMNKTTGVLGKTSCFLGTGCVMMSKVECTSQVY